MAFSLVANYGQTGSTSLTNRSPFALESAEGLSGASISRLEQRGPVQNGATDLGFRLKPRMLTLSLIFSATSDSTLDTYRQTLHTTFKPSQTVFLALTRDDSDVRYLQCKRVDDIEIELAPELRPGHTHRAIVKLRAANPTWYDNTVVVDTYTGGSSQVWWTAGGLIGTANVMEHTEFPSQGQVWSYAGTITADWSIAVYTQYQAASDGIAMFHAGSGSLKGGTALKDARFYYDNSAFGFMFQPNYYAVNNISGVTAYVTTQGTSSGFNLRRNYRDGADESNSAIQNFDISGTARRWRSDRLGSASSYWTAELEKAAVYNTELSAELAYRLSTWMAGTAILGTISAVNSGDLPEYPFITIAGPITNPKLTNTTTGAVLDLTGVTIGSGDAYYIDLRGGDKTILNASGSSVISVMSTPSQLAQWYLAPSPTATGGTNSIRVQGGSVSTITSVSISHYDRYLSF